jgi:23S rRNA (guanosine2251-2'-O)-methyltransferase
MEKEIKFSRMLNGKVIIFFLFGSEGSGMHEHTSKYADFLVKIDINKKIESLNISNSAAIVFHHLSYLKKNS